MVTISKPQHWFLRRHLKASLGFLALMLLAVAGIIALAYAEGVYHDPQRQLNNSFKVACDSGVLADRQIMISEDGEYNWMLAKGQLVTFHFSLGNIQNNSVRILFFSWSTHTIIREDILHTYTEPVDWTFTIPSSGHWQLELINYSGVPADINIKVIATNSGSLGLLDCLNPGDLFRRDFE